MVFVSRRPLETWQSGRSLERSWAVRTSGGIWIMFTPILTSQRIVQACLEWWEHIGDVLSASNECVLLPFFTNVIVSCQAKQSRQETFKNIYKKWHYLEINFGIHFLTHVWSPVSSICVLLFIAEKPGQDQPLFWLQPCRWTHGGGPKSHPLPMPRHGSEPGTVLYQISVPIYQWCSDPSSPPPSSFFPANPPHQLSPDLLSLSHFY